MATTNEEVRDALTRHQVRVLRFARSLERELVEILGEPNARIRDLILSLLRSFPKTGFRARSAVQKMKDFEERLGKLYGPIEVEARALVRNRLVEFAFREVEFTAALYAGLLPVEHEFDTPSRRDIRNRVRTQPFEGQNVTAWVAGLLQGDRNRITNQIRQGIVFDESSEEIERRIFGRRQLRGRDGIREVTRRGAATLARTLVNGTSNLARQQFAERNPVLQRELFVATLDRRTTAVCRANDGEVFPVGEGPTPPLHFNCRSLRVPFIDAERLGTRPANAATERELRGLRGPERREAVQRLVGRVPETQTYAEFLRNQSVAFQNEALGVRKAQLWRKGGLELDAFVDPTGREYTLDELYRLEPDAFVRAGLDAP